MVFGSVIIKKQACTDAQVELHSAMVAVVMTGRDADFTMADAEDTHK